MQERKIKVNGLIRSKFNKIRSSQNLLVDRSQGMSMPNLKSLSVVVLQKTCRKDVEEWTDGWKEGWMDGVKE